MDTLERQESVDAAVLQQFRYKQELSRRLNFFGSFAVAFSAISITTGVFVTYGFALKNCGPIAVWTWPLVAVGQILIAFIMAELAGRIPITGYAYQWISRLANPALGWLCGWTAVFFISLGIAATNFGLAPVIAQVMGVDPNSLNLGIIVAVVISLQAFINIRGVKLTSLLNNAAVYAEILGMVGIAAVVLVGGLLFRGTSVFHPKMLFAFAPGIKPWSIGALILGCLMGCWSMIGFEMAADLSEETLGASRVVPKSIITSIVVVAAVGTLFLFIITMVIPDLQKITNSVNPLPDILDAVLGRNLSLIFLFVVIVSMFACGVVWVATASRLIYSMARDDVFIFSGFFKKVSGTKVPQRAILFVLAINLLAIAFVGSFTDLIAATAILPAVVYLMTIGAYASRTKSLPPVSTFNLGKWSTPLTYIALVWLIGELGILTIPKEFHGGARVVLMILAAGAFVYFSVVRKHIVSGKAGIQDRYN